MVRVLIIDSFDFQFICSELICEPARKSPVAWMDFLDDDMRMLRVFPQDVNKRVSYGFDQLGFCSRLALWVI